MGTPALNWLFAEYQGFSEALGKRNQEFRKFSGEKPENGTNVAKLKVLSRCNQKARIVTRALWRIA
jgi:hypothetical protein